MNNDSNATLVARRIVQGLNIQPGELIQVRDRGCRKLDSLAKQPTIAS